jgi:excinuclease UvrABC helicase subunit UvrB
MNYKNWRVVVEQVIRPTGFWSHNEIRPSLNQIDDLIEEIQVRNWRACFSDDFNKEWPKN